MIYPTRTPPPPCQNWTLPQATIAELCLTSEAYSNSAVHQLIRFSATPCQTCSLFALCPSHYSCTAAGLVDDADAPIESIFLISTTQHPWVHHCVDKCGYEAYSSNEAHIINSVQLDGFGNWGDMFYKLFEQSSVPMLVSAGIVRTEVICNALVPGLSPFNDAIAPKSLEHLMFPKHYHL